MKQRHSLLERLSNRPALLGLLQMHPNVALTEMACLCGYDYLILDGEHGLFSEMDYVHALQTTTSDTLALIRVNGRDPRAVGRYLDMGADGIVVPDVRSAQHARDFALAMLYPPVGTRGFGASAHRTTHYGRELAAHLAAPRGHACLIVMIESAEGVANADEILAVEGVDGVFVGPFDLTADLGNAGDFALPAYTEALDRIERVAAARGKALGTGAHGTYTLERLVARGHRMLLLGSDTSLIQQAMSVQLAAARAKS